MPEAMEEVYIGMLGLTDSIPVYDANQNRIKKDIVKILNAQVNQLGPCLRELHLFTTLVELDLMSNKLIDNDLETLRVSCTLRSLNLSNNDLEEVPLVVENGLENLSKVILQGNPHLNITKCIQNLCGLRKLKHLDLSHTKIFTIPEDIRKIQTLKEINLSDTKILEGEIPSGVFSLKNLKVLITDEAFGRYEGSQLEDLFEDQILEGMDVNPTDKGEIFWKYSRGHALKLMKKVKKMEVKKQWPKPGSTVLELWLNSSMLGGLGEDGVDDLFKNMRNIQGFKQITLLSLCTNDLFQIPNLRHFDSIRQLGLCRNNLKAIPAHVLSLPNLTNLYITDNQIETLIFNAEDFPALIELHLQGNPICWVYDAAEACLESRKNLKHSDCAIQGLKDVMLKGSNLPRNEPDDIETQPEGNPMQHPGAMYPERVGPGYYPHPQQNAAVQYPRQQPYQPTPHGALGYGPQPGVQQPQYQANQSGIAMNQGQSLDEATIFKVLDASNVEDIDGPTEKNLRPKIETSDAWQEIADDLGMTRDEKDLLHADSKKDQHKTLLRLLLRKWEAADRSLGSLYRLLILKGYKQPARILKDGVLDSLQAKGDLQKWMVEKAPVVAPQHNMIPPHGATPYAQQVPYAGHLPYQTGPQGPPMYEAAGYPTQPYMVPYGQDPRQGQQFQGPQSGYHPYRSSPPPSYSGPEERSRKTSQPESSLGTMPSDCKLPDMGSLSLSNQAMYPQGSQGLFYPPSGQMHRQESALDYFGKRPSAGSNSSMPATEVLNTSSPQHRRSVDNTGSPHQRQSVDNTGSPHQRRSADYTGSPQQRRSVDNTGSPHQRRSVDNPVSFAQMTEVKQHQYREEESLQRNGGPVASEMSSPWPGTYNQPGGVQSGQAPLQYVQSGSGDSESYQGDPQNRRGSEVSDRLPCQNDDPSMTIPPQTIDYIATPQQTSMHSSVSSYPTMSDTQEPSMTDELMYRKVLVSANSTETEPPGFSDEAALRKELNLHQDS